MRPLSQPGGGRRRSRYVLLLVTLLAITFITLDARGVAVFSSAREGTMDAVSPVRGATRWLTTPFRNAWNGISGYDDLQAENERLREKIDEIEGTQMEGVNAKEQLERLNDQLGLDYVGDIPTQLARVSSGPYSNFSDDTLELDKGSDDGLEVGMPVVTKAGLVGRLDRVSSTRSVVQLITDPDFHIGVIIASSQEQGVGHGNGGRTFIVEHINLEAVVETGDVVLTGGVEGRIMPPNVPIPIGIVEKVTPDEGQRMQILQASFAVEFSQLDVVQVLKWTPER